MVPASTYFAFVETKTFERLAEQYLSDGELNRLEVFLNENPLAGNLIPETGGVRKLRWGMPGRGKQGGMRIICYSRSAQGQIWFANAVPEERDGEHAGLQTEEDEGGDRWLSASAT